MTDKKSPREEQEDLDDEEEFLNWYLPLGPGTEMEDILDKYGNPLKKKKKRKGGKVSRKRGGGSVNKAVPKRPSGKGKPYRPRSKPNRKGKIMVGYKAGGKV